MQKYREISSDGLTVVIPSRRLEGIEEYAKFLSIHNDGIDISNSKLTKLYFGLTDLRVELQDNTNTYTVQIPYVDLSVAVDFKD